MVNSDSANKSIQIGKSGEWPPDEVGTGYASEAKRLGDELRKERARSAALVKALERMTCNCDGGWAKCKKTCNEIIAFKALASYHGDDSGRTVCEHMNTDPLTCNKCRGERGEEGVK